MANFDWMNDPAFTTEIEARVSAAAARGRMERYELVIVAELGKLLRENAPQLLQEELVKVASVQRSKEDALQSVEVLILEASKIAGLEKRATVTGDDFRKAYAAKFCTVWPFCGKR